MNRFVFDLPDIIRSRVDQPSYHLASEDHLRIQMFNLKNGERLGKWKCDGNALINVLAGEVGISIDDCENQAKAMCQAIVSSGGQFQITARNGTAIVQIIWSPPFSRIEEIHQ